LISRKVYGLTGFFAVYGGRVWRNKKAIPSMAVSWVEMGGVKHIFEHLKLR
jgi:hypothetical protein